MIVNPPTGTRVKTLPDKLRAAYGLANMPEYVYPKRGCTVSYLGMLIHVRWDDGTESDINAMYLEYI